MNNHSFAVLAYKESPYLSKCLDSLKNQTVESDIYISTSTPSKYIYNIAKKYGVEIFISESGSGIGYDWNFGLKQAKTKYVTLAHQDDFYMPDYTEACLGIAEKFNETLICFTNYSEIVDEEDRPVTAMLAVKRVMLFFLMHFKKSIRLKFWKKKLLSFGSTIATPSVMYNLEKLTWFQFSDELSVALDWDAWYRMANMEGRFVYLNKVLVKHRLHSDSATTEGLGNNLRHYEDLKMFKRFWPDHLAKIFAKLYERSYKNNLLLICLSDLYFLT